MRAATTLGLWIFAGWLAGGIALAQQTAPADHAAGAKAVSTPAARHVVRKRRRTAHQDATGVEAPGTANAAADAAPRLATPRAAEDPISLGMKWNGSNDDARQTRIQNYDGNAAGTGAEVGLKLHF